MGLAVLATIAVTRTKGLLLADHGTHLAIASALTSGYTRAFAVGAIIAACAALVCMLAAPAAHKTSGFWHHAICAALGQPWHAEGKAQSQ